MTGVLRLEDAIALRYCRRGCRTFAERHGLDWSRFIGDGIPLDEVETIDDEMMRAAIAQARKREAGEA